MEVITFESEAYKAVAVSFLLCAVLVFYFLKSSFRLTVLLLISGCAQKPMNVM